MSYIGDIRLGETFDTKFTTTAAATGAPTTLAGTPVISAYVGNSVTQITAGITLTVDFDGVTGLHNIRVVATSGNGFATASNYQLVITTGTVGGTSAVGYVVAEFSIEARSGLMPTTAARTLAVDASGRALADVDTIKTNPVVNAGTITFPTTATLASTTNITAATGVVLSGVTHTGAVIPTVSAVTGLTASNLDAAVSSRMATYTQPTGFLAATFPGTVASTTNITAGVITTVTNLTNLPSIPANWLTAAGIAAAALNGKGDWNIGKGGYSLTQTFPANFAALSITAGGLADITQAAADKAWSTAARVLTAGTNIVLAKGTGVTGFNDLDAAGVAAATWNAATVTYGGAGTYGLLVETNLDAAVTSRLAAGATANANVVQVTGLTIVGVGTGASPWGPA